MHRKLWPKATKAKEGALGKMSKNFQVHFIHVIFLRRKKNYNRAKQLYCDATIIIFRFFIVQFPKKMKTEK